MKLSKVAMKRLVLLVLAVACLVPAMPAAAQPERPSRTEALAALKKSDADERRRGALGLAIVGRMEDGPALIAALRDADERVRTVAEQALWAVWSRSGDVRVDDLFGKGVAQMGEQRFPEAIATFTRVIEQTHPVRDELSLARKRVFELAGQRGCTAAALPMPHHDDFFDV